MRLNNAALAIQVLSIISGGLIYCVFRTKSLLLFDWIRFLSLEAPIDLIRTISYDSMSIIPNWLLFSLPDGLWVFSYSCLIWCIWDFKLNRGNIFWFALLPGLALGSEVMQLFRVLSGTFDCVDMLAYITGFLAPLFIFNINIKISNEK